MVDEAYQLLTDIVNTGQYTECARVAHETWRATKEAQGWKYGKERSNEEKTNPLMLPFDELPDEIKGLNSLTPYAVVNFIRTKEGKRTLHCLDELLKEMLDGKNGPLVQEMSEYVHSHFLVAQLPKGATPQTRKDMIVYEDLDQETQSWDTNSALEVIKYLRKRLIQQ
jgi:hypothetical protein